ncbi:MAG TPA: portal protein [Saccharofermentans sp.]|nr:portal protein [Saccharofermentans sp.]
MSWWANSLQNVLGMIGVNPKSNPKYETYSKADDEEEPKDSKKNKKPTDGSVVDEFVEDLNSDERMLVGGLGHFDQYTVGDKIYGSISTNKFARVISYRNMMNMAELGDAIEEIADACINFDENEELYSFSISDNIELDQYTKKRIVDTVKDYLSYFEFDNNFFDYLIKFITEGELAFENIVDSENADQGIIGVRYIGAECYEYAFNMKTRQKTGLTIFSQMLDAMNTTIAGQGVPLTNNQQTSIGNGQMGIKRNKSLFMPWSALTYIDSGAYSMNGTIVFPLLERARRAYNQLSLIEESIIIHRLARAPLRLVFNVGVGKLSKMRANEELLKIAKKYQTKKVYDKTTGSVSNAYDTHSITENYWFTRPEGTEGTNVETISPGVELGNLDDLNYFVRKLYLSLKVPYTRYAEPTVQIDSSDTPPYEEFKFARFCLRILNRIEKGLKEGIEKHLRLRGMWKTDKYELSQYDLNFSFTPPHLYDQYISQKTLDLKLNNYDKFVGITDKINNVGLKKYLDYTEEDIANLWNSIEAGKLRMAKIEFKENNVKDHGDPEPIMDDNKNKAW